MTSLGTGLQELTRIRISAARLLNLGPTRANALCMTLLFAAGALCQAQSNLVLQADGTILEADRIIADSVSLPSRPDTWTARIDAVVLHPVAGLLVLGLILFVMFQAVFAWAKPVMDLISAGFDWFGVLAHDVLPAGLLQSFIQNGVISGVGNVLVFLPQILILFLFILLLEDVGYMARAAFLMDRIMGGAGLHGRAFIPLLSSFACAIPGIMSTRVIDDRRDRLTTILVAPLMSCSARLPVYTVLIAACIPDTTILASVRGSYNAVWVRGFYGEDTFYYGRGAGSRPTGVAVASDLMRVAREIRLGSPERVSPFAHEQLGEYKPVPVTVQKSAYYLRFRVVDRPGIISALAGILAEKKISLDAVLQLPCDTKNDLPFVITVEPTSEQAVQDAVKQMAGLDFMVEPPLALPMERPL